jgi:hypothetical protein
VLPTDGAASPSKPRSVGLLIGAVVVIALIAGGVILRPKTPVATPPPDSPPKVAEDRPIHRPVQFPEPAQPQGTFALRIAVHPYADVVQATADGKPVTLAERVTPLVERGLPLADYEFLLRHPQLGEKKVRVPRGSLTPGKSYVIWGRMDGAELRVSESP